MGSSVGGALGNVVGQQDAGQIVGGVAGEQTLLKCSNVHTLICNRIFCMTKVPLLVPQLGQMLGTTWGTV